MNYIVTKSLKNKGLAVFLVVMFGGLGLFYSSIAGGIIMTLFFPLLLVVLFYSGHFFLLIGLCCIYYLICIIWAVNGVNIYNKSVVKYSSQYSPSYQDISEKVSPSNTYESPYSYYKEKDNSGIWLLLTIVILSAIIGGYIYFFK